MKLSQIMKTLDRIAPAELAESWDNTGLLCGNPDQEIKSIVVCLDITEDVYQLCVKEKANLCISHHPIIFDPILKLDYTNRYDALLINMIRQDIALFAAHTNLDACVGGVNDELLKILDLNPSSTFLPSADKLDNNAGIVPGIGRIGKLAKEIKLFTVYGKIIKKLKTSGCHVNFDQDRLVRKVLVIGGSYDSTWNKDVLDNDVDLIITGEMKQRDMIFFQRYQIAAIAAGHDATERVILKPLADLLNKEFPEIQFAVSYNLDYNKIVF